MPGAWAPSTSVSTPRSLSSGDEAFDREDERRRARDVVEEGEARPGRDGGEDGRDDVVLARERGRGRRPTTTRAPALAATNSIAFRQAG